MGLRGYRPYDLSFETVGPQYSPFLQGSEVWAPVLYSAFQDYITRDPKQGPILGTLGVSATGTLGLCGVSGCRGSVPMTFWVQGFRV